MAAAKTADRADAYAAEDEALADLIMGPELRAEPVRLRPGPASGPASPPGRPDPRLARPVTKVGVVGAGLMASQLALLFLRRLRGAGGHLRPRPGAGRPRPRLRRTPRSTSCWPSAASPPTRPTGCEALISGHHRPGRLRRLRLRDRGRLRGAGGQEAGLRRPGEARLSQTACWPPTPPRCRSRRWPPICAHPERLVGFHFFNPVAVLPLLEVVARRATDDATVATALGRGQVAEEERGAGRRTRPASWSTGC